jgi:dihydropteroate synthase
MPRKRHIWMVRDGEIALGERTLAMAIVQTGDPERVYARALRADEAGAGVVLLQGEIRPPDEEAELRRLSPALKRLRGNIAALLAVATSRSAVAARALDLGAHIVYDAGALSFDPHLARVIAQSRAGLVLAHLRGRPENWARQAPAPDIVALVSRDLEAARMRARRAGVDPHQIVCDPGLGLGKRKEENAALIARLGEIAATLAPVFVCEPPPGGARPPAPGALAAMMAAAVIGGAYGLGVHDVEGVAGALAEADLIASATV